MTIKISSNANTKGLLSVIEEMSGVDLSVCYQCKKCTCGCPVAKHSKFPPSEIIRRLHLGAGDELLKSDFIWLCLSCGTCYARCPMQIDFAAVADSLKHLALEKTKVNTKGNVPLFNRAFLQTVKAFGRTYDLGMIMVYKLGTMTLMNDTEKFPAMLRKGKMAMLPASGADKNIVKQIFSRAKQIRGNVK
jgi:heterodisulfide reductase subunit C